MGARLVYRLSCRATVSTHRMRAVQVGELSRLPAYSGTSGFGVISGAERNQSRRNR